jgi:release factor glutamine methyltransferase
MRIASNKFKDMVLFYHNELAGLYEAGEIDALMALAAEHYLGYTRNDVIQKADQNINQSDLIRLYDCAKNLKTGLPIQYVLGEAWFYDLKFKVSPSVLIPRPETEELVDLILKENKTAKSFLDFGTGSGCIPISIKHRLQTAEVKACDISTEGLALAKKNAELNKTEVRFFEADILNPETFTNNLSSRVVVMVSNPPYIKAEEKTAMSSHVLDHEPHLALFVEGADDIVFYKRIIDLCESYLNKNGKLYFELNPMTAKAVEAYAQQSGLFIKVELRKDLSGKVRFLTATKS